ncbi:MAG TPA: PEP-CTERM sorting domain-containing protein, partial [Rhodocyclaceae bacterium]|nr:PEP-CTERM sorting domain-containing protein [Rhodocyclaceae bacterium]
PGLVNYHNNTAVSSVVNEGPFGAGGFTTVDSTSGATFESWCVDVFHDFYFNSSTSKGDAVLTTSTTMFGATKARDLGRLATEAFPLVSGHSSSNVNSTAFQLAVWEIVNENVGSYNLSSGNFQASAGGGATAVAQGWLNALPSVSKYSANIWAMQGNGSSGWGPQDVVVFAPVPEPETYAMMLAGLGLMGAVARRRKSKQS